MEENHVTFLFFRNTGSSVIQKSVFNISANIQLTLVYILLSDCTKILENEINKSLVIFILWEENLFENNCFFTLLISAIQNKTLFLCNTQQNSFTFKAYVNQQVQTRDHVQACK